MELKQKHIVSVVIPTKDRFDFLINAVNSVRIQTLPENFSVEIIIVDDGSKSKPPKQLDTFPEVRLIKNNLNHGPSWSRNIGLKEAKGDFICFLDSDDSWKRGFLYESLQIHAKNDISATVCLTDPHFIGKFSLTRKIKILLLNYIRTTTLIVNYYFNNTKVPKSGFYLCQLSHMVFNKKYILNTKFNTRALVAEDWEFNVAVTKNNSIKIIPNKLVNFFYTNNSLTNEQKVINNKKHAYYKMLDNIPSTHKKGLLYQFFLIYIELFLLK